MPVPRAWTILLALSKQDVNKKPLILGDRRDVKNLVLKQIHTRNNTPKAKWDSENPSENAL